MTSAYLEETPDIEEATAFNIELIGYGISNYSYYRIYMPYGLSDLSLVVSEGQITLSSACYSGFYLMAESTKAKEPPFGKFTGLIRFLATVVTVALCTYNASFIQKRYFKYYLFWDFNYMCYCPARILHDICNNF